MPTDNALRDAHIRNLMHDLGGVSMRLLDTLDDVRTASKPQHDADWLLWANALVMRTTTATEHLNLLGSAPLLNSALTKLCARQSASVCVEGHPPPLRVQLADWCDLCNAIAAFIVGQHGASITLRWFTTESRTPSPYPLLRLTSNQTLLSEHVETAITSALAFSRCHASIENSNTASTLTLQVSADALLQAGA